MFDIVPEKLEEARRLGATHAVNTLEKDFMVQAKAITGRRGL